VTWIANAMSVRLDRFHISNLQEVALPDHNNMATYLLYSTCRKKREVRLPDSTRIEIEIDGSRTQSNDNDGELKSCFSAQSPPPETAGKKEIKPMRIKKKLRKKETTEESSFERETTEEMRGGFKG
jgi:hypothetical protein